MENYNEVVETLRKMGVENPTQAQVRNLACLILEGYQVEIFRQELSKVKQMREQCVHAAKQAICDNHPFAGGRDSMLQTITDAIRYQSEIPNLTHTVRYMITSEY